MPSGRKRLRERSNVDRSTAIEGQVSANSIAVLNVKFCKYKLFVAPKFFEKVRTACTFQVAEYCSSRCLL